MEQETRQRKPYNRVQCKLIDFGRGQAMFAAGSVDRVNGTYYSQIWFDSVRTLGCQVQFAEDAANGQVPGLVIGYGSNYPQLEYERCNVYGGKFFDKGTREYLGAGDHIWPRAQELGAEAFYRTYYPCDENGIATDRWNYNGQPFSWVRDYCC